MSSFTLVISSRAVSHSVERMSLASLPQVAEATLSLSVDCTLPMLVMIRVGGLSQGWKGLTRTLNWYSTSADA